MFLTEKEAQGRWCPFGRQPVMAGGNWITVNRMPNGDVPSCLGSLCMGWRWAETKKLRELDMVSGEVLDEEPRRGYCGYATKPEHGD